jgi:membrane-associated phospholipid phosphatase
VNASSLTNPGPTAVNSCIRRRGSARAACAAAAAALALTASVARAQPAGAPPEDATPRAAALPAPSAALPAPSTARPAKSAARRAPPAAAPEWRTAWRKLHTLDYIATVALTLGATVELTLPVGPAEDQKRSGGILFDDAARDAMVLHSADERSAFGTYSDFALGTLVAYPAIVDAVVTAWAVRGRPDIAWQMMVIDLQAFAFTSLVTGGIKRIVDRERPIGTECRKNPDYSPDCDTAGQHYSFLSGHASMTFTGAGLICVHHMQLSLLGSEADAVSCVAAVTAASLAGVSRVVADKHYVSDVMAGAALGLFSGAVLPYVLFHVPGGPGHAPTKSGFVAPAVGPSFIGATYLRPL